MKYPASLRAIPYALFGEYAVAETPPLVQSATFGQSGSDYTVSVCLAKDPGPNGPFTLVFKNKRCHYNRHHSTSFLVYPYPVRVSEFAPGESTYGHPLLDIRFFAEDPPYNPKTNEWIDGKGYWVNEFLSVHYGFNRESLVAGENHWEFGYLLGIQISAHEMTRTVQGRGHWQCEWDPQGNYSQRWTVRGY